MSKIEGYPLEIIIGDSSFSIEMLSRPVNNNLGGGGVVSLPKECKVKAAIFMNKDRCAIRCANTFRFIHFSFKNEDEFLMDRLVTLLEKNNMLLSKEIFLPLRR